jgi:hypothetical protein
MKEETIDDIVNGFLLMAIFAGAIFVVCLPFLKNPNINHDTIINYRPNDIINLSTIVEVKINRPVNYCIPEGENLRCGCGDIS